MTIELTPLEAATVARAVYAVRKEGGLSTDPRQRQMQTGLDKLSSDEGGFTTDEAFSGESGYSGLKAPLHYTQKKLLSPGGRTESKFGFFAKGEGSRAEHAIVATRGTAITPDVLTDLWAMPTTSAMGNRAHSGFVDTFSSYEDDLRAFASDIKGSVSTVHCIGHSLGGALATLNAEFLCHQGFEVKLYTFASPRVGFGSALKNCLHNNKVTVYRAYNDADPVPMVPVWPFIHSEGDCCTGRQVLINPMKHKMVSYISEVQHFSSWRAMQRAPDPVAHKDMTFLESALKTGQSFSAALLRAVMYALKKLIRAAEVIVGVAIIGTLALVDLLAWMFFKAKSLVEEFSKLLMKVMGGIMRFLGKALDTGAKMTETVIRYLLEQLFSAISSRASLALTATLADPAFGALPMTLPVTMMGGF